MPSFADNIFLVLLALLLFGPKKLPVLARELGKWVGEFRRASNEFKMQMEEELRVSEQAERQKQIAAMEAAAPVPPALPGEDPAAASDDSAAVTTDFAPENIYDVPDAPSDPVAVEAASEEAPTPLPIATSGDLSMMPPDTGLPVARGKVSQSNPLGALVDSIPSAESASTPIDHPTETAAHGN